MLTTRSEQEDFIQQIARALARLAELLVGGASAGPAFRDEVTQLSRRLLGADAGMLEQLDAVSAARLVGSQSRMDLWAQLLDLEAESWSRDGDAQRASAVKARAAALREAARG